MIPAARSHVVDRVRPLTDDASDVFYRDVRTLRRVTAYRDSWAGDWPPRRGDLVELEHGELGHDPGTTRVVAVARPDGGAA